MTKVQELADLESLLSLNTEIRSSVAPRWARKEHDRFIGRMDYETAQHLLEGENAGARPPREASSHAQALKAGLLSNGEARIIHYKDKAPAPPEGYVNSLRVLYTAQQPAHRRKAKATRHIPSAPSRVLDAPELVDDYYLNLVAWGANNKVAVALGPTVYVWDAATGSIVELLTLENEDYVCSVSWLPGETNDGHVAVGTASGATELWDVATTRALRRMDGHAARVSSLAWNSHIVSSGSRDATIVHHDVRVRDHAVGSCRGHVQEVCGLTWSPDGTMLASGGNDNLVCIWSAANTGVRAQDAARTLVEHSAAVKALAWSPHDRNLLATGAGTADRTIKLWNAQLGSALSSTDTGSQVCALAWNPHEKELLSGHGYADNQLTLWKSPGMTKIKELRGHTGRVLSLSVSPDGATALSAGADETLRFWDCFAAPGSGLNKAKKTHKPTFSSGRPLSIR